MSLFTHPDRKLASEFSGLAYCNPFLPERIKHERAILGTAFDERTADWNLHPDWGNDPPNVERMTVRAEQLAERVRDKLARGTETSGADSLLYQDVIIFLLYHQHRPELELAANAWSESRAARIDETWDAFAAGAERYLIHPSVTLSRAELAHVFSCYFHLCRAFRSVFRWILGVSKPAVQLRAAVWQSVFTHDMRRYRRVLFDRMGDYTTLVTGPSGTGKELVARAIALLALHPVRPTQQDAYGRQWRRCPFHTLNLSALSATLIESELFGHKRGCLHGRRRRPQGMAWSPARRWARYSWMRSAKSKPRFR